MHCFSWSEIHTSSLDVLRLSDFWDRLNCRYIFDGSDSHEEQFAQIKKSFIREYGTCVALVRAYLKRDIEPLYREIHRRHESMLDHYRILILDYVSLYPLIYRVRPRIVGAQGNC